MRYRKGRHPTTVNPHGIPTDVVDVQMGAHDRFTLETGGFDIGQKRAVSHAPAIDLSFLVVAEAGINDDAKAFRFNQQGVNTEQHIALLGHEMRLEPFDREQVVLGNTVKAKSMGMGRMVVSR